MRNTVKTLGFSALVGFLLILPFMIMEIVNRRAYHEGFPFMLFSGMWLNLFAISLMLLPVVQGWRAREREAANPVPAKGNTLLTNPRSSAVISVVLVLVILLIGWLGSIGWEPLDRLVNGPNPEVFYLPGVFIGLGMFAIPLAAGIIASGPVARTLRAGGSLFAHPVNLVIVVFLVSAISVGLVGLVMDQWPCFIGVPRCD